MFILWCKVGPFNMGVTKCFLLKPASGGHLRSCSLCHFLVGFIFKNESCGSVFLFCLGWISGPNAQSMWLQVNVCSVHAHGKSMLKEHLQTWVIFESNFIRSGTQRTATKHSLNHKVTHLQDLPGAPVCSCEQSDGFFRFCAASSPLTGTFSRERKRRSEEEEVCGFLLHSDVAAVLRVE